MTEEEWEKKWKALTERALAIKYEKNKPWSCKATGASASASVGSFGVTGLTVSISVVSVSITGLSLSFTGLWGQLYDRELKSGNGISKLLASRLEARLNDNERTICKAINYLVGNNMVSTASVLAASHLE